MSRMQVSNVRGLVMKFRKLVSDKSKKEWRQLCRVAPMYGDPFEILVDTVPHDCSKLENKVCEFTAHLQQEFDGLKLVASDVKVLEASPKIT